MCLIDPPGFRETCGRMKQARYGWAVLTSNNGRIGVIPVTDWEQAKRTMPYPWLNVHQRQPAPVDATAELAEETWKSLLRQRNRTKPKPKA